MEYTKDLILNVRYDEVNNTIRFKTKNRTSRFLEKIKNHKVITASILIACSLIMVDGILVINFIQVLEML